MAEKKVIEEEKTEVVKPAPQKSRQKLIVWLVVLGFVLLIAIVAGAIAVHHFLDRRLQAPNGGSQIQLMQRGGFGGGYQNGTFYSRSSSIDGPTTTTTTQKYTYTTGVITKVNSDSVVVAGNGKTQTIKTNSSTTYINDTKPAVNDTVRIVGTADDSDNVTATQIAVLNN